MSSDHSGQALLPTQASLRDGRTVVLRWACPQDAADLVEIQRQVIEENVANVDDRIASPKEHRQHLSPEDGRLWLIAEGGGRVVGSLELRRPGPSFLNHIRNLFVEVHRDWRGTGLGETMIRKAVEWSGRNGVEMIALSVLDSNPRARLLYERLGFRVTGQTPALVKRPDGSYSDDTQMVLFTSASLVAHTGFEPVLPP